MPDQKNNVLEEMRATLKEDLHHVIDGLSDIKDKAEHLSEEALAKASELAKKAKVKLSAFSRIK